MNLRASMLTTTAAAVLCLASPVLSVAEEEKELIGDMIPGEFSANVTLTSDYSFRGVSQTQEGPALQGGIDWSHDSGFFLGTWGSTIKFAGDKSYLEQDFYGGWGHSIGDFSFDVGAYFYWYPKEETYNYWEFQLNGGYDFGPAALSAGVLYSPNYFGTLGDGWYMSTGVSVPIPVDFVDLSVDANVGYTMTDDPIFTDDDYVDWNLGLVVGITEMISFDLRYVDTDENNVPGADARFIGGVTLSF